MFLILALFAVSAYAQTADMVVQNARIYTMDPKKPTAQSLALKDGKILAVGGDLKQYIDGSTKVIDAKGRAVLPGLIDSHGHMLGLGDILETFDLRTVNSIANVAAIVQKEAAKRPAGEWIRGRAWDQTNWGGEFPTAKELDAVAPKHPVYLTRVDGHAAWVNSKALQLAGITKATADPAGGKIVRDANGNPTGVLIDRAQRLVGQKIPAATDAEVEARLVRAAQECARVGLTSVHDAGIDAQTMAAYHRLVKADKLPIRVYAMIGGDGALWKEYQQKGPEIGERLTVRAIKLVADGAMGSRGAAFWQPYADDRGNTGLLILSKEQIEKVSREALKAGFQVCTHAIGDRANRTVLDAYAAALGGKNDKRFRIEHAQIVSLPDFALFREFNVIASMQATHETSDYRWVEKRLGPDRLAGAYAWQRFLKMGVPVANGSDFPVESPNPMLGFYSSITRQDLQGNPPGGWRPEERLSRSQTLESWTKTGAYAAFEEKIKGSLEPGKLADFVMLSTNVIEAPAMEIPKAQVLLTVVGGRVVHSGL